MADIKHKFFVRELVRIEKKFVLDLKKKLKYAVHRLKKTPMNFIGFSLDYAAVINYFSGAFFQRLGKAETGINFLKKLFFR